MTTYTARSRDKFKTVSIGGVKLSSSETQSLVKFCILVFALVLSAFTLLYVKNLMFGKTVNANEKRENEPFPASGV